MTSPPDPSPEAGFTLIEIIVVLVILGLMVGLVVTRGPLHSAALDVRAVGQTMAASLRAARARAIASDAPVIFALDTADHRYQIGNAAPVAIPPFIELSLRSASGVAAGAHRGGIAFAPDGSSTGGEISLAGGARHLRIAVNWLTGRVSLQDAP
jgi:general secretion pathway protein H